MVLSSINPGTGELIKEFEEWSIKKVDSQLNHSFKIYNEWQETSFSNRSDILKNMARILRKNKDKYAQLMTTEMGKTIVESEAEVEKCAWVCEFYAENGEKFLSNEIIKTDASKSYVCFEPLGIILAIMPWNFPFWQVIRCAVPALFSGNAVVLKHSSNVPQCALTLEDIFLKSGFPEDLFKTILIGSKQTEKIIKNSRIAAVSLTGSTIAGKKVAQTAGSLIKKSVLELGGNDPFIVLDDADLEYTVDMAVKARMVNNGQSCIAAKRFIVSDEIYKDFLELFIKRVEKLNVGNPLKKDTNIGPLARYDILEQLETQVVNSIKIGAIIETGGKRLENTSGFFYIPTILSNISEKMPLYKEETFGPVASVIKVKNEKEAIKIANDTKYGLGASIWTSDIKKGEELTKKIHAGSVFVNEIVKSDPRLPFGGIKESGIGRELSHYSIKEFVNIKTIYIK